jgi:hypothetical protein
VISLHGQVPPAQPQYAPCGPVPTHRACSVSNADSNYLSVFTKSAIAWACSLVSPAMPLL